MSTRGDLYRQAFAETDRLKELVMNERDEKQKIIEACANILTDTALKLIEEDPHSWSKRPCTTCHTISTIIGRPFGCERERLKP